MSGNNSSLSYKDAGVDIDAGNALVDRIKGAVKRTRRPEVMGGIGGLARYANCQLNTNNLYWFLVLMALAQNFA